MTASIPPGWYEDPSSPGSERWWDGTQWTASTRARERSEIPPPPAGIPPGGAVGPMSGYPQGAVGPGPAYPQGGYRSGPPYGAPPGSNRTKVIGLSVLALVVVGALVAVLLVVLGGEDDAQGVAAEGRVTDPATGLSIPRFKGWTVQDPDEPADQYFSRPCSPTEPTGSSTAEPEPSDSADSAADDCYRAAVSVLTEEADSFEKLTQDLKRDVVGSTKITVTDTELDKRITVDGRPAYVLRVKVRGTPDDLEMDSDTAWAQIVAIDEKNADGKYPCVAIKLEDSAKAPDKSVLDAIVKGIKVGTPTPTESTS